MNDIRLLLIASLLATVAGMVPASAAPAPVAAEPPAVSGHPPKYWSIAMAETIMRRNSGTPTDQFARWSYYQGFALYGFEMLWRSTGDSRYLAFIRRQIDPFIDAQGRIEGVGFGWLDNTLPGNLVVALYEQTGEERYRVAAAQIRQTFDTHPRNSDGGFWHAVGTPGEMWIDGVFMGQMFLLRYGRTVGDREWCYNEAIRQITLFARHTLKADTGFYLHAWAERPELATVWPKRTVHWADPKSGLSPEVWSEGLGWYALVLSEALSILPADYPRRSEVVDIFLRLATGLKRTQDPASGRWFQVVDKGDLSDNWTDTSGSAMFTYMLEKGIEMHLLDEAEYGPVLSRAYRGITSRAHLNADGLVDLYGACDGVCVQADYAAYVNYPRSINAKEAVGAFLWATTMFEKPAAPSQALSPR
jgi:rhamnogalacturonyl hydrolase YesR